MFTRGISLRIQGLVALLASLLACLQDRLAQFLAGRRWAARTLVVGPSAPVDGDSVACTAALIQHLRSRGHEAYTLPTLAMYAQIKWILNFGHFHPACRPQGVQDLVTDDLQACYDALLRVWRPDEIVLVDGQPDRLGFDTRGVPVFTIDHHVDRGERDDSQAYIKRAPAAGCLLIQRYGIYDPVLAASILTDTFWLRQNLPSEAIESLYLLRGRGGLTDEKLVEIQDKLRVPGNPQVIQSIRHCRIWQSADWAFVVLDDAGPELHREVCAELGYFFKHFCVVRGDGYTSFRTSDRSLDISRLASRWQGGGHPNMAACVLPELSDRLLRSLQQEFCQTVAATES